MLKLGEKSISDLYLGDKAITKAYLDDRLVFNSSPTFVESVAFDGNSYIDTGIVPVFGDEFEIEFTTQYNSQECVFCAGTGDYQFVAVQNPQFYYKYFETGGARGVSTSLFPQELTLCKFPSDGSIIVNNKVVMYPLTTLTPQTVNTNLFIGVRANKTKFFEGLIGKCKLTGADGTVKLNLQPCIDKDGIVCFYDAVSKRYLYNQGTGTLTTG